MLVSRDKFAGFLTGYGLVLALTLVTASLVLVHGGRFLNFGFPLMCGILAAFLILTRRSVYVAFVWWIWLFTPLVRRLVDFQTSYHDVSPVMTSPLLVTGYAAIALLMRPGVLLRRSMAPFLCLLLVFLFALIVGSATNGFFGAFYDFLGVAMPAAFGIFLTMYPDEFDEMRASLIFAIVFGLIFTSAYGIYQFYSIPPWDAYWLHASKFDSAGEATAFQVRLWGTLNSPQPYGVALMASLVFAAVSKGPMRLIAGTLGVPAFGLSLVRSAWGGLAIALLYTAWRIGGVARIRIAAVTTIAILAAVPIIEAGPLESTLSSRFSSLNNLGQDESFQARIALYSQSTVTAFSEPLGRGFGAVGTATKLVSGQAVDFDSGILQIPLEFGWVGGSLFVFCVFTLLKNVLRINRGNFDAIANAGTGLFIAMLAQNVFSSTFGGILGVALWVGFAVSNGPIAASRSGHRVIPIVTSQSILSTT